MTSPKSPRPSSPGPRIALAGGYTAGHVMPMIAVAEAWRASFPGSTPIFLGQRDGLEADLLLGAGLPFHGITGRPLYGITGRAGRLRSYGAVLAGMVQARRVLRAERVDLLLGFGAYVTAGILLAGRSLGMPTAVFEANVLPGMTNRRLAKRVDLRFVNWPETREHPGWSDAQVVGLPVRRALLEGAGKGGAVSRPRRLLVTGGSLGSPFLNEAAPRLVARLKAEGLEVEVLHQAGRGREGGIAEAYAAAGVTARVGGFLDDMAAAWTWADATVCAAGAGTLAEARSTGTPALVVPIAAVADHHQALNATAFAAASGQPWVPEDAWDDARAAALVAGMLRTPAPQPQAAPAAEAIVRACLTLLPRPYTERR